MKIVKDKRNWIILISLFSLLFISACTTQPVKPQKQLLPFDTAIQKLAQELFSQIESDRPLLFKKANILFDPFIDANSGEVIRVSQSIAKQIKTEKDINFTPFELKDIMPEYLATADYIINGIISLEPYDISEETKHYHISASAFSMDTGKIVAHSEVWIKEVDLDYTPVSLYQDSPMYLKDAQFKGLVKTARSQVGEKVDMRYYELLEVNALLLQASQAYDNQEYEKAFKLFNQIAEHEAGQVMKTYAGLYQVARKLNDMQAAEIAFGKMFALGVENDNLSVKFLFSVNKTNFVKNKAVRNQYKIWLRQIGQFFSTHKHCLQIKGHSSRSGAEQYNDNLSLERAEKIQNLLKQHFAGITKKSKAMGIGFRENIIGTGTDDARDAVDRRVEFAIIDCEQL